MALADSSAPNNPQRSSMRSPPGTLTQRISFSREFFEALVDVHHDLVCFQNGLSGAALGYTWRVNSAPVPENKQRTLRELWRVDCIDIETHRLIATCGHDVRLTDPGYQQLLSWEHQSERIRKRTGAPTLSHRPVTQVAKTS